MNYSSTSNNIFDFNLNDVPCKSNLISQDPNDMNFSNTPMQGYIFDLKYFANRSNYSIQTEFEPAVESSSDFNVNQTHNSNNSLLDSMNYEQNSSNKVDDMNDPINFDITMLESEVDEVPGNEIIPLLNTSHTDYFDDVNTTHYDSHELLLPNITPTLNCMQIANQGEEPDRNSRCINTEERLQIYNQKFKNDRILKEAIINRTKVVVFGSMLTIEGSIDYFKCIAEKKLLCPKNQEIVNEAIRCFQRVRPYGRDLLNIDKYPERYAIKCSENKIRTQDSRIRTQGT